VEGDAAVERREQALADDVGDEVGADLCEEIPQVPEARRHHVQGHGRRQNADHEREREERPKKPRRRHPGGAYHDELGITVKLVERVKDRNEQRDRRDHGQERRQGERRHGEEHHERLALAGEKIELAQGLGYPDDRRQPDKAGEKGASCDPEDVALDQAHAVRLLYALRYSLSERCGKREAC